MRKVILLLAILLVGVMVGVWRYAPELVAYAIRYDAATRGIDIARVDVGRINWNRLEITALDLSTRSDLGDVVVAVKDLEVDYDPWSRSLRRIAAGQVRVTGDVRPPPAARDRAEPQLPLLPPLNVADLRIDLTSPVGPVRFNGLVSGQASAGSAELRLSDELGVVSLRYDAAGPVLEGKIAQAGDAGSFLSGTLSLDGSSPTGFVADADLPATLAWAQNTSLLPPGYRDAIAALQLQEGSLHATGEVKPDQRWSIDGRLGWQNLQWQQYRSSGELAGGVTGSIGQWRWRSQAPGTLRVILTDADQARSSEVIAVELGLATGYEVTGSWPQQAGLDIAGTGDGTLYAIRKDGMVLRGGNPDWQLRDNASTGRLSLNSLQLQTTDVVAARLSTTLRRLDDSFQNWSGDVSISNLRLSNWPPGLRGAGLQGQWQSTPKSIAASGSMDIPQPGMTDWHLKVHERDGSLRVNLAAPAPLLLDWGRPLTGIPKRTLNLNAGTLNASIDIEWNDDKYRSAANISARQVDGKLVESEFSGMTVEATSAELLPPAAAFRLSAQQGRLAGGASWRNLYMAGRWSPGELGVSQAGVEMLGGSLSLAPFSLSLDGSQTPRTVVDLAGIDLSQLLEFLGQEALSGEGTLDGSLPIVISPQGPRVEHAVLFSTVPGHIRYRPANDNDAPGVDNLALRALRDLRYKVLNATLTYRSDGNYAVRLRLEGNNPQVYDGYPIALNLNLSGVLPDLLQASLLTGDFSAAVLKQLQREQGTAGQ
jgi:hypothetical protein